MCAEVAKVASLKSGREKAPEYDPAWALDAALAVELFNGPAMLVSQSAEPVSCNAHADVLAQTLKDRDIPLLTLVQRALDTGVPVFQKLTIDMAAGSRHFDVHAIPLDPAAKAGSSGEAGALILGRESTLDHNLTKALVDSRQMFKDMVGCSPDFAWETDAQGILRYVSPRGAFGHRAHELTGRRAADLLAGSDSDNPFVARERVDGQAVTLVRADGSKVQARISATPVLNDKGEWLGARGLCQDVDDLERTDKARKEAEDRLTLNLKLTGLLRDMVTPERLLGSMAEAISGSLDRPCLMFRKKDGLFSCGGTSTDRFSNKTIDCLGTEIAQIAEGHRTKARRHYHLTVDGETFEVLPVLRQSAVTGAIAVAAGAAGLGQNAHAVMNDGADHLATAVELLSNRETVRSLTRTDELTGLLTPDAFAAEAGKKMKHQSRTGAPAALLLVQVDDFAAINDRFGHPCGESVLHEVGAALTDGSRIADLACRLEDHRFALWLVGADVGGAQRKARLIVRQVRDIAVGPSGQQLSLSVSVGGAVKAAEDTLALDRLMAQAGAALQQASGKGRGQWVISGSETDRDNNV